MAARTARHTATPSHLAFTAKTKVQKVRTDTGLATQRTVATQYAGAS